MGGDKSPVSAPESSSTCRTREDNGRCLLPALKGGNGEEERGEDPKV